MASKARSAASRPRKIFGLSITEDVEWAVDYAYEGELCGEMKSGVFPDVPTGNLPHLRRNEFTNIESAIRENLIALKKQRPDLFDDVEGIGVSTIGVVDRKLLALESLVRKNWGKPNSKHVIDFGALFLGVPGRGERLFPHISKKEQIVVQNDASARCLAEYLYGDANVERLFYIMVDEGINGAVAYSGDLLEMLRHSEMGHCMPRLHDDDLEFDNTHSGCPSHKQCFEGLASWARIRQQWPNLDQLSPAHPAWQREIFYLAQFAMIGVTTLNPQKIIFGGKIFADKNGVPLINEISSAFLELNAGYFPDYKSKTAVKRLLGRAKYANGIKVLSALTMGCLAAFPEDRAKPLADKVVELSTYRRRE